MSHSTVEAEIVAANHGVRTAGLPALDLWETILERKVKLNFFEDNQATARIMETGKAPTLRHIQRTHQVNIAWLSDVIKTQKSINLCDCDTNCMAADIFYQ